MKDQKLYMGPEAPEVSLDEYFHGMEIKHVFLVCGRSIRFLCLNDYFSTLEERLGIKVTRFSDYTPNPAYESAVEGAELFRKEGCDCIVAVGGGSAMDVAKCVKLFATLDPSVSYLEQSYEDNGIPFLAVPTTAGTGSEATHFAVIYDGGKKLSIAHESAVPQAVVFDPTTLVSLPDYQRKATMMDALCHAIESCWSVKANDESRRIAKEAIWQVLSSKDEYLANTPEGNRSMLLAANMAGKAINLTQTTAGHAMCYKLTGIFGISHGHAAALCVSVLWPFMIAHADESVCPEGESGLKQVFSELADLWGALTPQEAAAQFSALVAELGLNTLKRPDAKKEGSANAANAADSADAAEPVKATQELINTLADSVNLQRLKNNPVALTRDEIVELYEEIFRRYGA